MILLQRSKYHLSFLRMRRKYNTYMYAVGVVTPSPALVVLYS